MKSKLSNFNMWFFKITRVDNIYKNGCVKILVVVVYRKQVEPRFLLIKSSELNSQFFSI